MHDISNTPTGIENTKRTSSVDMPASSENSSPALLEVFESFWLDDDEEVGSHGWFITDKDGFTVVF